MVKFNKVQNIPKISFSNIIKFWEREYSIFTMSSWVTMLKIINSQKFGEGAFTRFICFYNNGISQHFRSKLEEKIFEKTVGEKIIHNQKLKEYLLNSHTLNAKELLKLFHNIEQSNTFPPSFIRNFNKRFGIFAGANTCIQRAADYIIKFNKYRDISNQLIIQRTKYEYVMSHYDKYVNILCKKIGKNKKIQNSKLLNLLTIDEFINFIKNDILPEDLEKRQEGIAIFILPKPTMLVGKSADKLINKLIKIEDKKNKALIYKKTISGTGIYPKKVCGRVQIILNSKKLKSFKSGRILVAPTTLPQYNSAFRKAKGIITDEGGVLTHAAVLSREFKIPGIVGTRIATKILKNNQLVELDSLKGIVTILE